ncbi:MAG: hypothetical protein Q8S43_05965 [Actinomycetota bacterium]|nr:hypothetical protein [Actinomycetota bacterium]
MATDAFDMGLGIPASEAKINDAVSDLSESVVLPAEAILGPPAFYYVDMDQPVAERGLSIAYDKSDVRLSVEPGWSEDRLKNMAQRSISATDTVVAIRGNESSISIGSNLGTTLVTVSPGEAVSVAHGRIKVEARVLFVRGGFLYTLRSYDAAPELLAAAAESVIGAK